MERKSRNVVFTDRSIDSVNHFLRQISRYKPLTTAEERELWAQIRQGDNQARERLICANLRYAVSVAKKFLWSKAPFEDLIQAGCEGIIKATKMFDATLGYRFISYATWFVENEVRKAAIDYVTHDSESLDAPYYADEEDGSKVADHLCAHPSQSTDWNLRYLDALADLKQRAEKRQFGFGPLAADLHQMLLDGYTTNDFAQKHHLKERQMTRFLTILREEAVAHRPLAA